MRVELGGKVALVTGAARGIGQAIADRLAENGAEVWYTDIDETTSAAAAAGRPGARHAALDVTSVQAAAAVVERIVVESGRLDILVNNAGVNTLAHRVTIDEFPPDEWRRILDVDLTGVYNVSRAAAAAMKRQRSGRIVNVASVAGLVPLRLQSAFVAAKAGVVNLSRSMAIELGGQGILVNCVAPGSTLTEGTRKLFYGDDGLFRESVQTLLDHIPLGRPGTVDEVAHAVLFLAAPEASYINGAVLTVDGGWTAGYLREF